MRTILFAFLILIFVPFCKAQDSLLVSIDSIFVKHGVAGCFVWFNASDSSYIKHNEAYCDTGYIPASTFKIPHALIALQEEVVHDTNQLILWDDKERAYTQWNQDQNLGSAIRNSCVWVFSGFTDYIETSTYQKYVNQFNYGNKIITGTPHVFWLAGQFRISANQQVDFLERFYTEQLGIDKKYTQWVKEIIVLEQNPDYLLSGKTGSGKVSDTEWIMWLVGYVEKDEALYYYALNFVTDDLSGTQSARLLILEDILSLMDL